MSLSVVAAGEVGIMADENTQRLCSLLSEEAHSCLKQLCDLSKKHPTAQRAGLIKAGLDAISSWNADIVAEEEATCTNMYPELPELARFAYLSLLEETQGVSETLEPRHLQAPPLGEVFHSFMRRISASPDVTNDLEGFLGSPMGERRVVYISALRDALHDSLRKRVSVKLRPAAAPPVNTALNFRGESREGPMTMADTCSNLAPSDSASQTGRKPARGGVFSAAMDTISNSSRIERDELQQPTTPPPPDNKLIEVSNPCFFDEHPHRRSVLNLDGLDGEDNIPSP